jgi:hypothetical protein
MGDLQSPKLIYLKGFLFLVGIGLTSAMLLMESPTIRTTLLVAILIWSSARFYYFVFYVIGRYVDPSYRFAGLGAFAQYLWQKRKRITPESK